MIAIQVDLLGLDADHGKGMFTTIRQFTEQNRTQREFFVIREGIHRLNNEQLGIAQPVAILRLKADNGMLAAPQTHERLLHPRENAPEASMQIAEVFAVLE
jgi:hypothetical protein